MVIVDTSVWVDYLRGTDTPGVGWLDAELERQRLGLTDLIFCEVLQGARTDAEFARLRRELSKLEIHPMGGATLAVAAAANYRALRKRGSTVPKTIDCLIATFCMVNGHTLLHADRDFDPFEAFLGLRVVHPG